MFKSVYKTIFAARFTSSCGLLGIDIGSRSIKMLQLRSQGSHLAVVGAAEAAVAPTKITGGTSKKDTERTEDDATAMPTIEKESAASLGERIRAIFTSGGFTGRRCVVSLPRNDLFVQAVRLPKMPEAELRQAARWEAAERFGLDPEASEVDILRTGASTGGGPASSSAEGREEVLVIAAPHAVIHARLKPILDAGLRPVSIDTHFCALARIFSRQFRREADRQYVRIVLEVGAAGSTVLILRGSEIAFCKTINIGGQQFNQAVAEHLQLDLASAIELRAARMLGDTDGRPDFESEHLDAAASADPATDRAIYEAVRPFMGELVKDVSLCLRYYGVTFRGKPAYQVILTGGECQEPHLAQMLRSACKLPVVFDDEPETLTRLLPRIGSILHRMPGPPSQWAVAAGLSIRNIDEAIERTEERSAVRSGATQNRESGSDTGESAAVQRVTASAVKASADHSSSDSRREAA